MDATKEIEEILQIVADSRDHDLQASFEEYSVLPNPKITYIKQLMEEIEKNSQEDKKIWKIGYLYPALESVAPGFISEYLPHQEAKGL